MHARGMTVGPPAQMTRRRNRRATAWLHHRGCLRREHAPDIVILARLPRRNRLQPDHAAHAAVAGLVLELAIAANRQRPGSRRARRRDGARVGATVPALPVDLTRGQMSNGRHHRPRDADGGRRPRPHPLRRPLQRRLRHRPPRRRRRALRHDGRRLDAAARRDHHHQSRVAQRQSVLARVRLRPLPRPERVRDLARQRRAALRRLGVARQARQLRRRALHVPIRQHLSR